MESFNATIRKSKKRYESSVIPQEQSGVTESVSKDLDNYYIYLNNSDHYSNDNGR